MDDVEHRTLITRALDAVFAREDQGAAVATHTLTMLRYVDGMIVAGAANWVAALSRAP